MRPIATYQNIIADYFQKLTIESEPRNLYEPINYILSLGGKRIRPVLTLIAAEIFDADCQKALAAATAIEIFHNFSLVHDDIMDDAPLRRGHKTVHEKWNINTGILSGDAMLIMAYQHFEEYSPNIFVQLAKLFSKTAIEVCEGQQFDVDFETRFDVTIPEYLKMIECKTAVLLAAALKMGAIVAETTEQNANLIYDFGLNLGLAFQLQDDFLDAFGDPATFGKQIGGDIIENKKTFLYLKAIENGTIQEKIELLKWFTTTETDNSKKIEAVKAIFESTAAKQKSQKEIVEYTERAFQTLEKMDISEEKKSVLKKFGENLMTRQV